MPHPVRPPWLQIVNPFALLRALRARFASHLYVRIWFAVVIAVVVLLFFVGWAWRASNEVPVRELTVRNETGQLLGTAQTDPERRRGEDMQFNIVTPDGRTLNILLSRLNRSPSNAWMQPFGIFWTLVVVGLAVALGAYPVIRRLTTRLEALRGSVERWGDGDLSARVVVQGHDEVAFLAERFNHAAEQIQTLVQSQQTLLLAHKSLLANASHELRSPLARIRMGLELLTMDGMPKLQAEIARSIHELDQLVDEILLASRLDAQQPDAEPLESVDLTGLAAEECARVNAQLMVQPLPPPSTGHTDHGLVLQGSPRLLRRLLRNLLENARRYSTGAITVGLALLPRTAGAPPVAQIRVSDHGPGVPAEHRERIFEPFYRLPGASEGEGGVGLGLALVKSIALRHQGQVYCQERPGGGACFVVELPLGAYSNSQ